MLFFFSRAACGTSKISNPWRKFAYLWVSFGWRESADGRVQALRKKRSEACKRLCPIPTQPRATRLRANCWNFFTKKAGKSVAAYGAAAKGNTLLNCGVKPDLLPFVAMLQQPQNKYCPVAIFHLESCRNIKLADYLVVLPWNIAKEVKSHWLKISRIPSL